MLKTPTKLYRHRLRAKSSVVEEILKRHGLSPEVIAEAAKPKKSEEEEEEEFFNPFQIIAHQMEQGCSALESRGIIFISGEISKESLSRASRKLLEMHFDPDFQEEVQIILNSPGGYTDAGWAFIDLMDFVKMPIRTIAMGEICSMATSMFISGDHRIMAPNACAMIHQFSWVAAGSYSDLVASRKAEDMEHKREIRHLILHSKYDNEEDIRENILLDKDHWLTPEEMKKHGLCDEVFCPPKYRKQRKAGVRKAVRKKPTVRKKAANRKKR